MNSLSHIKPSLQWTRGSFAPPHQPPLSHFPCLQSCRRVGITKFSISTISAQGERERNLHTLPLLRLPKRHLLVIIDKAVALGKLAGLIHGMTRKEEVVSGFDRQGKPHKQERVDGQGPSHLSTDNLGIPLHVRHRCQRKAPIGHWPPKVSAAQVCAEFLALHMGEEPTGPGCRRHDMRKDEKERNKKKETREGRKNVKGQNKEMDR